MSHNRTAAVCLSLVLVCVAGCGGQPASNPASPAATSQSAATADATALPLPASPTVDQTMATATSVSLPTMQITATVANPAPTDEQSTASPTTATITNDQPTPTPLPSGAQASNLSPTQLKYLLIDRFGAVGTPSGIFYCDPDQYPLARVVEPGQVDNWFNSVDKTSEEYRTVLQHAKLESVPNLTDGQKLQIYQAYKELNAISLVKQGDLYQFGLRISQSAQGRKASGLYITGTITEQGAITVLNQQPTILSCPICLALGTRIDTPAGPVPVQDIQPGMIIWTVGRSGARTAAPVLQTSHTPVPAGHMVIHLRLDDGRELWASAGHPTTDGRLIGNLASGDTLDNAHVLSVTAERYAAAETYDVLPAGQTGDYWADGILIGSTLAPSTAP